MQRAIRSCALTVGASSQVVNLRAAVEAFGDSKAKEGTLCGGQERETNRIEAAAKQGVGMSMVIRSGISSRAAATVGRAADQSVGSRRRFWCLARANVLPNVTSCGQPRHRRTFRSSRCDSRRWTSSRPSHNLGQAAAPSGNEALQ